MEKKFWKSKKFWAAVIAGLIPILREFGIDVPPETAYAALGYLGATGLADIGKSKSK